MVVSCSALGCVNRWKVKKDLADGERNLAFHRFPLENEDLLNKWLKASGREKWTPSENARMCEDHFVPSDYNYPPEIIKKNIIWRKHLKKDAVPSVFNFPNKSKSTDSPVTTKQASTECAKTAEATTNPPNTSSCQTESRTSEESTVNSWSPISRVPRPAPSNLYPPVANVTKPGNPPKKTKQAAKLDHSYANEKSPWDLCTQYRRKIIEKDTKLRSLRKSKIRLEKNVKGLVAKLKASRLLNKTLSNTLKYTFGYEITGGVENVTKSIADSITARLPQENYQFPFVATAGWQGSFLYKGPVYQQIQINNPVPKITQESQTPIEDPDM